ncbi:DMT family transporter [Halomonas urumqiensis]|uniref:EamA family transporter n=1 Tax=Halomonas urumqiensis TaxID=1684789 RepID=A0A2N7UHL4_9GAMM|nr:DMT family transporter [Halomonas urumqiensis]PMR79924.1 EamA family transporter [Halomonas urumqiensis]PTB02051.1 EamA/RhaT family transporter [Halomonas urumqiensis]GHE21490.1 membrane protein [Halomonas urumqiensis]
MRLPHHSLHLPGLYSLACALIAVMLWAVAPLLVHAAAGIAPLRLTALSLLAGALVTLPLASRGAAPQRGQDTLSRGWTITLHGLLPLLILGAVGGYFSGLGKAPAAEAALITYTWPVLFVLLSQWRTQGRVTPAAVIGSTIAFAGAALLLAPKAGAESGAAEWAGYALAMLAACCWALYSWLCQVAPLPLTRLMPRLLMSASVLAATASLWFEGTTPPASTTALLAAVAIGAGPYGLAMVAWDVALRHGDSRRVGCMAYGVPVFAALFLVLAGLSSPGWQLPVAAALVVVGCLKASR